MCGYHSDGYPLFPVPSGPARNITVERIGFTTVSVTWEVPDYEDINAVGGITGYRVVIGNRRCNQNLKLSETTNLRVVFDNLEPGSIYCVRVFPLNNVGVTPNDIVRNSAVRVELPYLPRKSVVKLHHHHVCYTVCIPQLHQFLLDRLSTVHMPLLCGRRWSPTMRRTLSLTTLLTSPAAIKLSLSLPVVCTIT